MKQEGFNEKEKESEAGSKRLILCEVYCRIIID
jgi:hypothetical protein